MRKQLPPTEKPNQKLQMAQKASALLRGFGRTQVNVLKERQRKRELAEAERDQNDGVIKMDLNRRRWHWVNLYVYSNSKLEYILFQLLTLSLKVLPRNSQTLEQKARIMIQGRFERWGRGRYGGIRYGFRRARFRLYRGQILQLSMRWKALAEIYKVHSFAPFSWDPSG